MQRKSMLWIVLVVLVVGAVCVGPPPASLGADLAPTTQRIERLVHTVGTVLGQP